jgi:hypothetical protein
VKFAQQALDQFAEVFGQPARFVEDTETQVAVGQWRFVVASARTGNLADVAAAIARLPTSKRRGTIPLVFAPHMGEAGAMRCHEASVAWMDLSGNARIIAPNLRIVIEGRPNRFVRRGRPANTFAPKSARIARYFLMHPHERVLQRDLAEATRLTPGYTSRITGRLLAMELLERTDAGELFVPDPDMLLDAWAERYEFTRHRIYAGHVTGRTGEEVTRRLADRLTEQLVPHAFTGLAAAWQYSQFAAYRLTTVFLLGDDHAPPFNELGFRLDERGANTWLVLPNDPGVADGSRDQDGIICVHPVQAWLDLQAHPERATEAAVELRKNELNWHDR